MFNDSQCPKCGKTLPWGTVCWCQMSEPNNLNYADVMKDVELDLQERQLKNDYETFNKIHEVDPTLAKLWLDLKEQIRCLDTYEVKEPLEQQAYEIQKETGVETLVRWHVHRATMRAVASFNTSAVKAAIERDMYNNVFLRGYVGDDDEIK